MQLNIVNNVGQISGHAEPTGSGSFDKIFKEVFMQIIVSMTYDASISFF